MSAKHKSLTEHNAWNLHEIKTIQSLETVLKEEIDLDGQLQKYEMWSKSIETEDLKFVHCKVTYIMMSR